MRRGAAEIAGGVIAAAQFLDRQVVHNLPPQDAEAFREGFIKRLGQLGADNFLSLYRAALMEGDPALTETLEQIVQADQLGIHDE